MTNVLSPPVDQGVSWSVVSKQQHTLGHLDCPACEEMRAMFSCSITADLTFSHASTLYLQLRSIAATPGAVSARYIRKNTEKDYERKLRAVSLFFGDTPLNEIRWYNMKAYQQARIAGDEPFVRKRHPHDKEPRSCPAKAKQANQEMSLLKQIKVKANCWSDEDNAYFEYLQEEESDVQRALDPEQHRRWLDVTRSNPRWELVHWWSLVALDTLMSTNELRGLRLGDINLQHQIIKVPWPAAKNRFRHRSIPLENPDALWALDRLIARAHELGAGDPQHYLFPFRITRSKEAFPGKHMTSSGLKKLWEEVRLASGLKWFRMYDTRHTGATRMAEDGIPPEVIMRRLGHASDAMRQHYTHIFEQAQRRWLRGRRPSYDEMPRYSPEPDHSIRPPGRYCEVRK